MGVPRKLTIDGGVAAIAAAAPFVLWSGVREWPPWGDEAHFLDTVRQFGAGVSVELLRSYNELSAPLTYIVYAAWGSLAGFDTSSLRLLSPILASVTVLLYWRVLAREEFTPGTVGAVLALLAFSPYFVGTSVFVFTDMLALCGMAVTWKGLQARRPWVVAIGLAAATLTRQYLIFVTVALLAATALARTEPNRLRANLAGAAIVAMIPFAVLVSLWGGALSPVNPLREMYLSEGVRFDPHALSLYLATPAVYLAPLVFMTLLRARWQEWAAGAPAAAWAIAFPVQASAAQLQDGVTTVGFFHRALVYAGGPWLAFAGFVLSALLSFAAIAVWWNDTRPQDDRTIGAWFPWLALGSFLLIMPFSFQPWEKYALPQLMICGFLFAASRSSVRAHVHPPGTAL
jgi:hypothetical protein